MNYSVLNIHEQEGVAFVTIDNPPLNVLDIKLMTELSQFIQAVKTDENVKVIVLQSADPDYFVAHGDMNFITNPEIFSNPEMAVAPINPMQQLHEAIRTLPQVTIAKIAGYARGGGHELALAFDMRFAAIEKTGLAQPEAFMGIIPGGGGTQYLTRSIGRARTLEMILGAQLYDAVTAEKYGLINRALPLDQLDTFVDTLAKRIASLPAGVANATKAAVNAATGDIMTGLTEENKQCMELFVKPVTVERALAAMKLGAQTREGEKDLEKILYSL